jgi:hypothetical protein
VRATEFKRPIVNNANRGNEKIVMRGRTNGRGCVDITANSFQRSVEENSLADCNPVSVGTDFASFNPKSIVIVSVTDGNNTGMIDVTKEFFVLFDEGGLFCKRIMIGQRVGKDGIVYRKSE